MSHPNPVLRPIRESDFDALAYLVGTIGHGLTSLPNEPDFLVHRINDSLRAFDPRVHKPGGETYLFVLEDAATGRIIGTSGLLSRVGGFDPFYTYTIQHHVQDYPPLNIRTELETLHLTKNHKGPTEICSLFLHKDFRSAGLGRLLSLSRFCFLKTFPDRFDEEVIAELRGYINDSGYPPFWQAVGQKFFKHDYYTADILSGVGEKDFIEALMPKYPIYISLLPEDARKAIGQVHEHTEPARRILLKEGFEETNEVDIFDAGPILKAKRTELKTWKNLRALPATAGNPARSQVQRALLANTSLDFRATIGMIEVKGKESAVIEPAVMEALNLSNEEPILYLPF